MRETCVYIFFLFFFLRITICVFLCTFFFISLSRNRQTICVKKVYVYILCGCSSFAFGQTFYQKLNTDTRNNCARTKRRVINGKQFFLVRSSAYCLCNISLPVNKCGLWLYSRKILPIFINKSTSVYCCVGRFTCRT